MKKIKNTIVCAAALCSLFFLDSCAKKSRPVENAAKDELVLAIGGEPDEGFDPCAGWGRYGSPLFQSTLLEFNKDMQIVNDLAESYSVSADGLEWTFTIKSGVKFSDGRPLSAEDVAFTYNTTKETAGEIDLSRLKEARSEGETKVIFALNEPFSAFPYTAVSLGIVAKHAYSPSYGQNPIGSGPYKFARWDKGQQLIAERNENYYGPKPAFKKLTLLFLDEDGALAAAESGLADVAMTQPSFVREIEGYSILRCKTVDNRGVSLPSTKSGGKNAEGLAVGNDVTSDLAIRKALVYGVNRQKIIDAAVSGYGQAAYSVCDFMPWWNAETKIKDGDAEGQKAALEAAGWKAGPDGVREKNGVRASFELLYPASDSLRQAIGYAFAQEARILGVEVKLSGASWDDIGRKMYSQPVVFGWGSHSPMEVYFLYSSKVATSGYNNITNVSNKKVDAYMEAALTALTEEEANLNWKKAQWDGETGFSNLGDATWCWIANIEHLYFARSGLDTGNQRIHPHGHGFPVISNIKEWKFK
ncbi:MAG: ABC transporter substrate-binding protein [Spirochaetaceae bacterium]|nr:ABC transporter substrate-binding protein [Spirochaetaceae bacterium]